ncbi:hypothetical protein niasHT_035845 [Heterodera trifolii]|uniref:BTB domain-containing protein n=1 Tax=Heterodera trifolii TaxID=157864 RepID=A0ABD2ID13_9BILA
MSSSSKQGNPIELLKYLLRSGEDADIHFLVGDEDKKELLSAHKLILKHSSNVFEAMFRFDAQKEKTENASAVSPVVVTDVEPAAFKAMLSFIYSGDLSELNGENAMAVLYTAKKYAIHRLVNSVLEIPISELRSVFESFVHARLFEMEDFSHQCLYYICQNACQLFKSVEFLQIDQNLLCELFDRDQLVISSEFELWTAALRWADEKCRQNAIECSAENRRAALGPALFNIRFPLISPAEFAEDIAPSGVLSNDEFGGVYQFNTYPKNFRGVPGLFPLKFPIQNRISDWNTAKGNNTGTLAMEIEKFSEFSREEKLELMKKALTFLTKALKNVFNFSFGVPLQHQQQKELMDPCNGFYNKIEDKVTLVIDLFVEEEKKFDSDPNKSNGTIVMEIDKLSEFAREVYLSERNSKSIQIKGIPWKLVAVKISNKCLVVALECSPQKDPNWSCECSTTFRILSQKRGKNGFTDNFEKRIFNVKKYRCFYTTVTFEELMDPSKGLYDEDGDKITMAIDFIVEEKNGKKRKLADE